MAADLAELSFALFSSKPCSAHPCSSQLPEQVLVGLRLLLLHLWGSNSFTFTEEQLYRTPQSLLAFARQVTHTFSVDPCSSFSVTLHEQRALGWFFQAAAPTVGICWHRCPAMPSR